MAPPRYLVAESEEGLRLDAALALLAAPSRSQALRWIEEGRVTLNGRAVAPSRKVKAGDWIEAEPPEPVPSELAPEAIPLSILYEDAALVVLDKAPGMVVHPGPGHPRGTLVHALLHHCGALAEVGGVQRPGIVHRLDRGTSGVMVVAKHDEAHRELARQFHDREIEKEYVALVWGVVQAGRRIDAAIGRDPGNRQRMSTRARRAREAVTRITRAHHLRGLTLCQVAIHTGRTHQIRVHLSGIGHPVVGDALYGGVHRRVPGDIRAVQRLTRPFLHAERLAFTHPREGRRMEWTAPLPADLRDVLEALPGWNDDEEA